ncbi:hypothetical protein MRS44_010871 [Fusarium solani]|uniref:Cupin type-1 domain-containing protein n=1 Tax=Fusarium solani TaxID=169388 RepID=A0A9P9KUS4_FUSSL|nr:uncharacterized protein B0J15DRAFT_442128 [Fusarium solani]KAH7268919.1 hypothetical protein B0J15DRAFT_442128 [Fusarium solani]KAJ3460004.1 hypothetical protein MRS44_010871 [Fusarium solani]KAJ4207586.1 hypothetical protein NW759_013987 [Fusarium solani]
MASTEMTAIAPPEQYVLPATKYCPNNEMPVLIYRNVLPSPRTEKSVQEWIEKNGWLRAGIVWPAIYRRHFHPNVHECYAVLSGSSEVLMGVGKLDEAATPESEASSQLGLLLTLREGDVIVHPAGTGHSNVSDEGRYRYLSFFPEGSPKWISENGDKPLRDNEDLWELIKNVPMPQDPVTGGEGHLTRAWKAGSVKNAVV